MEESGPIRVGAVSYLNTKPLVYGLEDVSRRVDLSFDLPSRLADRLRNGQLDVALIPSIEFLASESGRGGDLSIVSNACIGCRGAVWSVVLMSRVPWREIRTLAVDEGSRTSIALARILLDQRFGIRPRLLPLPIDQRLEEADGDGLLVIGDRAMKARVSNMADRWDLGEEWRRWTGLPFVFAMWVARAGVSNAPIGRWLDRARDLGLRNLDAIASRECAAHGLTRDDCLGYLRDNLHFRLGTREREGLERFRHYATELGMLPSRGEPHDRTAVEPSVARRE
ncbi:MAG: menaquinone biosynthesis protein [Planctomycetes bacterium]|nr:menaquinone biosynthesis protein [Planctomycetota bacterium]